MFLCWAFVNHKKHVILWQNNNVTSTKNEESMIKKECPISSLIPLLSYKSSLHISPCFVIVYVMVINSCFEKNSEQ